MMLSRVSAPGPCDVAWLDGGPLWRMTACSVAQVKHVLEAWESAL